MAEPAALVELAVAAERAGWDAFFLWDHMVVDRAGVEIVDPWVTLGAIAARTDRIRLGTCVTPLARRRPQKVARETVTLDRLSGGRLVLGVGVGLSRRGVHDLRRGRGRARRCRRGSTRR